MILHSLRIFHWGKFINVAQGVEIRHILEIQASFLLYFDLNIELKWEDDWITEYPCSVLVFNTV